MPLRLGDINFALGADDKGLRASVKKLQDFGNVVTRTSKSQAKGAAKAAAALRKQERAIISALKQVRDLNAATRRLGASGTFIAASNRSFKALTTTMTAGKLSALGFQRAQTRLALSLGNTSRKLKNVANRKNIKNAKDLSDRMRDFASAASLGLGPLNGLASRITTFAVAARRAGFATAAFLVGIAAATVGVFKLGTAIIRNARQLAAIRGQLEAVSGSASQAAKTFADVVSISRRSGQSLVNIGSQYAKFTAAVKGTNLEGEKARKIFEAVALTAGKLQLPAEQVQGIFKAIEQIMSKGTVQAEELRNQLGDRLPGAFGIAARAMGITIKELGKMLKAGKLLSEDFLPKFAAEMIKTFNVGSQIDTLQASFQNLATSATLFLDKLDKLLGVSTLFKAVLDSIAGALDFMARNLVTLLSSIGAVAGALLALSAGAILAGITKVITLVRTLTAAMLVLNIAILANPVGGLIGLFVRLSIALAGALAGFFAMKALLGDATTSFDTLGDAVDEYNASIKQAVKASVDMGQVLEGQLRKRIDETAISIFVLTQRMRELNSESVFFEVLRNIGTSLGFGNDSFNAIAAQLEELRKQQTADFKRLDALATNRARLDPKTALSSGIDTKLLAKQQEALENSNMQLARMRERLHELQIGGVKALEALDKKFAQTDKIEKFRDLLKQTGELLSPEKMAQKIQAFTESLVMFDKIKPKMEEVKAVIDKLENVMTRSFERIGDGIADMVARGKFDLDSFANIWRSIVSDILKEVIRLTVVKSIVGSVIGGTGFAGLFGGLFGGGGEAAGARKGAAFDGGIRKLAKGGLLTSSTLFSTAGGPVLGGEAGKEAILPLRRTPSGDLGVVAAGAGTPTINITIQTANPEAFRKSEGQIGTILRRAVIQAQRSM